MCLCLCRYDRNWNDTCLIEFLTVLIAGKMKEGYRLVGNFVYEYIDSLTELGSKKGKRKVRHRPEIPHHEQFHNVAVAYVEGAIQQASKRRHEYP